MRVLDFVLEVSAALVVDVALVAGSCLAALAGCIGNRRRIIVKPGTWFEPSILWIVLVLRSGGKKTPALNAVLAHLQGREAAEIEEARQRQSVYEEQLEEWKAQPSGKRGKRPEKPKPANRLLVSDVTTEGLLAVHSTAPLGLLLYRDELGGWLRSYNQYRARGLGGDAQTWCEMHQGNAALVDRKGGTPLSVPRAAVSIIGGMQPELLHLGLSGEHLADGIAARLLFIAPPETLKSWSENTIDQETQQDWNRLLDQLQALEPDVEGNPVDLPMTDEAKSAWVSYYEEHAQREAEANGPFRAALSKLEAATARLALILELADCPEAAAVGPEAMRAGIAISEWFEEQAFLIYQQMEGDEEERDRRDLCDWIANRGGGTTIREVTRHGPNRFRSRAKAALGDLVAAGLVEEKRTGGKRSKRYVLLDRTKVEGEAE